MTRALSLERQIVPIIQIRYNFGVILSSNDFFYSQSMEFVTAFSGNLSSSGSYYDVHRINVFRCLDTIIATYKTSEVHYWHRNFESNGYYVPFSFMWCA